MRKHWPLLILPFAYLALRIPYLSLLPMWDGWMYYHRLIEAGSHYWANIFLWGHSSLFWGTLCLIPQKLFPQSWLALNSFLLVLDLLALLAFTRVLHAGKRPLWETALLCALLAFHPIVVATQLNFNLDGGIAILFPIYLYFWTRREPFGCALVGCALALTKETGLALAIFPPLADAAWFSWRAKRPVFSRSWRLAILTPLTAFVLVTMARWIFPSAQRGAGTIVYSGSPSSTSEFLDLLLPWRNWSSWLAFLKLALVFNYTWALTLVISVCFFWRRWAGKRLPVHAPALGTVFFLTLLLVTRYPTFLNARYVVAVVPLLVLLAARELPLALKHPFARALVLIGILSLQVDGLFASRDPITRWLTGRMSFGEHFLYDATKLNPDRRESGFDESVYNTQFTELGTLLDLTMEHIRPKLDTVIVGEGWTNDARLLGALDRATFHRRMPGEASWWPKYRKIADLKVAPLPPELWLVSIPMRPFGGELDWLREKYSDEEPVVIRHRGYQLDAIHFQKPRL